MKTKPVNLSPGEIIVPGNIKYIDFLNWFVNVKQFDLLKVQQRYRGVQKLKLGKRILIEFKV